MSETPLRMAGDQNSAQVVAVFRDEAIIVDTQEQAWISRFPLENNSQKIYFDVQSRLLILASWEAGISAYDLQTGRISWRNHDLTKVNILRKSFPTP